jgi:RNA recognition motif-containing protein
MSKRLFVGNLTDEVTNQELEAFFKDYGDVVKAEVVSGRRGRNRGYGYVELADEEQADQAVDQLNGQELAGRAVTVAEARSRGPRRPQDDLDRWGRPPRRGFGDRPRR